MEENEPKREKTKEETDRKCPDCGGVMDYNPGTGGLSCPYCGHEETIEKKEEHVRVDEKSFDEASLTDNCDWGVEKKSIICKSCGAETIYDANQIASECPYCGSNQVTEAKDSKSIAPDGVCPFEITVQQAGENFRKWLKGNFFCTEQAKKKARTENFKGVYIPFWTFDVDTFSVYRAEYGIDRTEGSGKESRTVTDWYPIRGNYSYFFDDLPVCATNRYDAAMLKGLEPYKTEDSKQYKPEYLAGYAAERYTIGLKDGWKNGMTRTQEELKEQISGRIKKMKGADHVRDLNFNTEYYDLKYKYLLLPVWISAFKVGDKIYKFMVNGQTGKVNGEWPLDWVKVIIIAIIVIALIYFFSSCGDSETTSYLQRQLQLYAA